MAFQVSLVYVKPPTQNTTKKNTIELSIVDACNPNTQEAEAESTAMN